MAHLTIICVLSVLALTLPAGLSLTCSVIDDLPMPPSPPSPPPVLSPPPATSPPPSTISPPPGGSFLNFYEPRTLKHHVIPGASECPGANPVCVSLNIKREVRYPNDATFAQGGDWIRNKYEGPWAGCENMATGVTAQTFCDTIMTKYLSNPAFNTTKAWNFMEDTVGDSVEARTLPVQSSVSDVKCCTTPNCNAMTNQGTFTEYLSSSLLSPSVAAFAIAGAGSLLLSLMF